MYDLLIRKSRDLPEIENALRALFGLSRQEICMVASIEYAEAGFPLIAECVEIQGDFQMRLSIYGNQLIAAPAEIVIARSLSQMLQTELLISDQSIDPFTWILIDPSGKSSSVSLDPSGLDRNEYRLAG